MSGWLDVLQNAIMMPIGSEKVQSSLTFYGSLSDIASLLLRPSRESFLMDYPPISLIWSDFKDWHSSETELEGGPIVMAHRWNTTPMNLGSYRNVEFRILLDRFLCALHLIYVINVRGLMNGGLLSSFSRSIDGLEHHDPFVSSFWIPRTTLPQGTHACYTSKMLPGHCCIVNSSSFHFRRGHMHNFLNLASW
jgi:hypothetical protein